MADTITPDVALPLIHNRVERLHERVDLNMIPRAEVAQALEGIAADLADVVAQLAEVTGR